MIILIRILLTTLTLSDQGVVAAGYGRGSKKLGFPTANLPHFNEDISKHNIVNGVYCGLAKLNGDNRVYKCVSNIGKSPTFVSQVIILIIIVRLNQSGKYC